MSEDFERLPPNDLQAEMCVLGSAMLETEAAITVVDELTTGDFLRPAHQVVFDAIAALVNRAETVNPVSVRVELDKYRESGHVPAATYLFELIQVVPTSSNVRYYTDLLRRTSALRRLAEAGPRITGLGYRTNPDDATDAIERAQQILDEATRQDTKTTVPALPELLAPFLDALEAGDDTSGVTTGLTDLDQLLKRLRPGQLITIGARPGCGKALALDTPLPTPTGWTTMKDVAAGDHVLGMDGKPTRVLAATEVMYGRPCYDVEFSDGTVITADAEHLWLTETRASRRAAAHPRGYVFKRESPLSRDQRWKSEKPSIKTTEQIRETLRVGSDHRLNHSIPVANAIECPEADLPIDPYVLGYWLGDGSSYGPQITVGGEDLDSLLEQLTRAGYFYSPPAQTKNAWLVTFRAHEKKHVRKDNLRLIMRDLGLRRNKHIPDIYLRASEAQRRALLAGLLDSDGTVGASGRVLFEVTNRRLAYQARELIASLGYQPKISTKKVRGHTVESSTCYRVGFTASDELFRLKRKAERMSSATRDVTRRRYVVDVRPVKTVPVRCIMVDNTDHMYLASEAFIPTHNSIFMAGLAHHVGLTLGQPVYVSTLEMSAAEYTARLLSRDGKINLTRLLERSLLTEDDWKQLSASYNRLTAAEHLYIDDQPLNGIGQIRAQLRSMRRNGHPAALAVVDYLQLMRSSGRAANRQEEVSELSRSLKLLAKEEGVPIVVGSQLNRGPEQRSDKRPMVSDLRESGSVEQDSDVVILLHREDLYDPETARAGEVDMIIGKNRSGPTGTVTAAFQGHYSRIMDMAPEPWSPYKGAA